MISDLKKTTDQKMQKSLEALKTDLGKIRTGRAHTGILDHVQVDDTLRIRPGEKIEVPFSYRMEWPQGSQVHVHDA